MTALPLLLAAAVAAGCSGRVSPARLDPVPELDCRLPFGGFTASTDSRPDAGEAGGPSERLGVLLAGRLVGELPAGAADSWRLASDGEATLLAHRRGTGPPDALLYAEAFSPRAATRPSEELRRFELTVDPALLDEQLTWPAEGTAWAGAPADGRQAKALRRLAWMASTRTGGRGLGYESSPGTFTGWRWLGRNRQGVHLHLARTSGRWSGQTDLASDLLAVLPRLVQRFPRLSWMAAAGGGTREPILAFMVLGTATAGGTGIHLALVCAAVPTCAPAEDLAGLLGSLRPGGAEDGQLQAEPGPLEPFAAELGIALAPREWLPDAASPRPAG